MGAQAHEIAVGQIVRDVPVAASAVLNTHVAQYGVEIEDRHVKRLGHLRGGQGILSRFVHHSQSRADDLVCHGQNLLRTGQTSYICHLPFYICHLKFLPSQHEFGTRLVVELRGDVQALGFGELVIGYLFRSTVRQIVDSGQQCKFASLYLLPRWLHLSNGPHEVRMILACHFSYFQ